MVATMRTPDTDLIRLNEGLNILALDITSADSITMAVEAARPLAGLNTITRISILKGSRL